ncbi:MAG: hypothetical protein HUJ61_05625 [Bacilli bacterium]|nr:hypothetical protein [Bacilli bacterium]
MKKKNILLATILLGTALGTTSCDDANTISICASEVPHAKILNEVVKDILKEKGYKLKVRVIDWTIQNDAVASGDYYANYFQHIPYLNLYEGETKLAPACKVHYEKLCLYAKDVNHKEIVNGDKIEIVDDISNIERALKLLEDNNILTINESNYDENGDFKNFNTSDPNSCVTFKDEYKNCSLTCIKEAFLCASLPDYNFGVIPGNTALTGLGNDYTERIVFGENPSAETISEKANIICVKEENLYNAKTVALVESFADSRVSTYISTTFGSSVTYAYESLISLEK